MTDSLAVQMNRAVQALALILQRHEDKIYRLSIQTTALGVLAVEALLSTGISPEMSQKRVHEAIADAAKGAPSQARQAIPKEIEQTIQMLEQLARNLETQN